jgi:Holliday junction resolvase
MNTHRIGLRFEMEIKKKLNEWNLVCLNLGYNEIADLVVVNGKTRVIECKTTHRDSFYFSKNPYQRDRLIELTRHNISVYYAVKFIKKNRSVIRFYYLNDVLQDDKLVLRANEINSYSLEEFISHCGGYKEGSINELLKELKEND